MGDGGIEAFFENIVTAFRLFFTTKSEGDVIADSLNDLNRRVGAADTKAESALSAAEDAEKKCTTEGGHYQPLQWDHRMPEQFATPASMYISQISLDSKGHVIEFGASPLPEIPTENAYDKEEIDEIQNELSFLHIDGKTQLHIPFVLPSTLTEATMPTITRVNKIKYGYLRYKQDESYGLWTRCRFYGEMQIADDTTIAKYNGTSAATIIKDIRDGKDARLDNVTMKVHYNNSAMPLLGQYYQAPAFTGRDISYNPNLVAPQVPVTLNVQAYYNAKGEKTFRFEIDGYCYCYWNDFNGEYDAEQRYCMFEFFDSAFKQSDCTSYL